MSTPASPLRWPAEALWAAVVPEWPGFSIEVLPEIDSTNTELMRRSRNGVNDPILLIAERQTAGRGRSGRTWHGEVGQALTFSLGLPYQPQSWSGLSLAVGLSLAESLGPEIQLKWPNDLWRQHRKLGGILIEAASQGGKSYAVIGIGLNIQMPPTQDLRTPATAIAEFWQEATAPTVLERIIQPLLKALKGFETQGFAPLQQRFNARDALRGLNVQSSDALEGLCEGVDSQGALQLLTRHGHQTIHSSEVSVRPL
ncbi:MAG: biotin--[acetyl-CoA-carboxylase] ligase [Limnohabitans sp.]|jgi:BirA family biotin operon repressor/biotin-[acetyl-CoA-carboxylase] ligase